MTVAARLPAMRAPVDMHQASVARERTTHRILVLKEVRTHARRSAHQSERSQELTQVDAFSSKLFEPGQ